MQYTRSKGFAGFCVLVARPGLVMSVTLPRTLFNFLCCHTNHNFVLRRISRFITPRNYALSWESVEDRRFTPPFQSVRFKSKSKIRRDSGIHKSYLFFSVKVISLTDDLKLSIKDHEMTEEYNKVVASFQNDLCQRLCLRLTPEILYSIPVSLIDANKKLLSLFLPVFFLLKIFRFPTNAYSWAM